MSRSIISAALLLPSAALAQHAPAGVPAPAPQDVLVFSAATFAAAQPATAYDMILRVPGFTFDPGDATVRGLAGAAGNVLIDGRRPATKDALDIVLQRIPASAVLRIELIRSGAQGGAQGMDLQGQPVVANIVRRREAAVRGQIEGSLGRYGDARIVPALRADLSRRDNGTLTEGSARLYASVDNSKGYGPRIRTNADGSPRETTYYNEHDGFRGGEASLTHERDVGGGRLRLNASFTRDHERADTALDTSFPVIAHERVIELETKDDAEFGATWNRAFAHGLSLELVALQRLTRDDASQRADDGTGIDAESERATGRESVASARLRWQPRPALSIEGGGEAAYNVLDSHAALSIDGVPVALPAADVRVAERRGEMFTTIVWQAGKPLTIEAGLRLEASRLVQSGDSQLTKAFLFPKPHLLVTWTAGQHTQVRARIDRTVGQLDFADFVSSASLTSNTVTAGNAALEPDRRWNASLAWDHRFWGDGALVLTARHDWIDHVLDRVGIVGPGFAFDAPGNIGNGTKTRLSAELSLALDRLGIRHVLIKGNVGYRWTSVVDPVTGLRRAISDEQPIDGEVHLTDDLPRLNARWGADLILGTVKYEYRFNEFRRSVVGNRLSLFAEVKPAPRWAIRIYVENITGRGVERDRAIYAGARNVAPLRYNETRDLATRPLFGLLARRSFGG